MSLRKSSCSTCHPFADGLLDLARVPVGVGAADLAADHRAHQVPAGGDHADAMNAAFAAEDFGDPIIDDFEVAGRNDVAHGERIVRR